MFTGIVESIGTVKSIRPLKQGYELSIDSGIDLSNDAVGDSIAVDGVCLPPPPSRGSASRLPPQGRPCPGPPWET